MTPLEITRARRPSVRWLLPPSCTCRHCLLCLSPRPPSSGSPGPEEHTRSLYLNLLQNRLSSYGCFQPWPHAELTVFVKDFQRLNEKKKKKQVFTERLGTCNPRISAVSRNLDGQRKKKKQNPPSKQTKNNENAERASTEEFRDVKSCGYWTTCSGSDFQNFFLRID